MGGCFFLSVTITFPGILHARTRIIFLRLDDQKNLFENVYYIIAVVLSANSIKAACCLSGEKQIAAIIQSGTAGCVTLIIKKSKSLEE